MSKRSFAMRLVFALALLATVASAQPDVNVRVDKESYEASEPITVRVQVANPGNETLRLFAEYGCEVELYVNQRRLSVGPCQAAETPRDLAPGEAYESVYHLSPDSVVFGADGTQTITARSRIAVYAEGYPGSGRDPNWNPQPGSVSFTAPRSDVGVLSVSFVDTISPEAFVPLRDSLNAEVLGYRQRYALREETWFARGVNEAEVVERYREDTRFYSFEASGEAGFAEYTSQGGVITSTALLSLVPTGMQTYPNPCRADCSVELRARDLTDPVRVIVYDARGREIVVIHDGPLARETQRWTLPVSSWAAGTYSIRAEVDGRRFASTTLSLAR